MVIVGGVREEHLPLTLRPPDKMFCKIPKSSWVIFIRIPISKDFTKEKICFFYCFLWFFHVNLTDGPTVISCGETLTLMIHFVVGCVYKTTNKLWYMSIKSEVYLLVLLLLLMPLKCAHLMGYMVALVCLFSNFSVVL